jgi:hypothetical protein
MENGNGKSVVDVKLLVPAPLAQAILNYLQERPFKEVQPLISEFLKCGQPHECSVSFTPPKQEFIPAPLEDPDV